MRRPIHPRELLADELAALNMNVVTLAHTLNVPHNRIYQILAGKQAMTADTALRLSRWLGTSPALWMNLQTMYELRRAEQEAGAEINRTVSQRAQAGRD